MSDHAAAYRDDIQDRARAAERAAIIHWILNNLHLGPIATVDAIRRGDHQ